MVDPVIGSTSASTVDAHRKEIAVYPMVYGAHLARNKKVSAEAKMLSAQQEAVERALGQLQARVMDELDKLPRGGMARIAEALGVDQGMVTLWKQGDQMPTKYLPVLPSLLGVDPGWFLTGVGSREPVEPEMAVVKLQVIGKVMGADLATLERWAKERSEAPDPEAEKAGEAALVERLHREESPAAAEVEAPLDRQAGGDRPGR
jgi:hypothetical protein